jgi:hypothetical protein
MVARAQVAQIADAVAPDKGEDGQAKTVSSILPHER